MSRKDWSESYRQEVVDKKVNKRNKLDIEIDHLLSANWQESYPKKEEF